MEIWEGFREGAVFDLDLDRSPGPGRQMRRRHFKQRQGDKETLGSRHVARGSVLEQKEGGKNGRRSRSEAGLQELGHLCLERFSTS